MDVAFRPGDTLLTGVLGVLCWCDALARALPDDRDQADVPELAERQLLEPVPDDALHFLLGLVAFERRFRAALERDVRSRAPAAPASRSHGITPARGDAIGR
jgi:hypothetical protein